MSPSAKPSTKKRTTKKRPSKKSAAKKKNGSSKRAAKKRTSRPPKKAAKSAAKAGKSTAKRRTKKAAAKTKKSEPPPTHNVANVKKAAARAAEAMSAPASEKTKRPRALTAKAAATQAIAKARKSAKLKAEQVAQAAERVARAPARQAEKASGGRQGHPKLRTKICSLFGVEYPIVQTGMGWVSGAKLTAATSEAGGLGILAAATLTYPELEETIHKVKERTGKPFGVNLRADQADIMKRVDLLIREKVHVASFAQAPGEATVKRLKDAGLITMPTIGARRHAEKVQAWGVDAVIAQGQEGGGHTGVVPTSILIPDVATAVDIPVIAAGGFRDGRGLVAALALGAEGIAMGTRFLLTQESQVPDHVKNVYLKTKVDGTVVTRAVDGYPQRVIRTPLIEKLEKSNILTRFPQAAVNALQLALITRTALPDLIEEGLAMKRNQELTWAQLAMAANAPMLTKASMVDGKVEVGILPTGQITGVIDEIPTVDELIQRVIGEAKETLERLGA